MAVIRDIRYLNKDFTDFRSQLINFSQTYFPTTYTDFSPSSPGIMFMEQASYVGDVLSFYLGNQSGLVINLPDNKVSVDNAIISCVFFKPFGVRTKVEP